MRLSADWLHGSDSRAVTRALTAEGHLALFVGGCVRNALLGAPVSDLDIATDATPDETVRLAEAAGLKAVPTGAAHGTITVVAGGRPFEVTTFRRDVATDGRHAVVAFSTRVEEDAARRDFTMNALYAAPDGAVIDPLGGLADLRAGRVRFIGDPAQRIAEDYLRILRFFRFTAWYGDPDLGIDAEGLAACAAGIPGLGRVSAERVGHEVRRLLAAPDPAPAVAAMAASGVLAAVLPGADPAPLSVLMACESEAGAAPDPICRLALIGGENPAERLRLSKAEARRCALLRSLTGASAGAAELAYRHGAETARDVLLLRVALAGQPLSPDFAAEIATGAAARFPISATDLMPELSGAALGTALEQLESDWIASGFTLDRATLIARVRGES
ncbi:MAG: CCA tRNA nucleotidyltransferase [Rhodobacteraceae bacterium]|nr:CCA tRNA nucleotidyltransferase [Paracoccaceae bacterium]